MHRIIQTLFLTFLVTSVAFAKVTEAMHAKFEDVRTQLLKIDLKTPANDSAYVAKFAELNSAFEVINKAFWQMPKDTFDSAELHQMTKRNDAVAIQVQFFKTPVDVIENKFEPESCYNAWRELESSRSLVEEQLFEHFRKFLKDRCKLDTTLEN